VLALSPAEFGKLLSTRPHPMPPRNAALASLEAIGTRRRPAVPLHHQCRVGKSFPMMRLRSSISSTFSNSATSLTASLSAVERALDPCKDQGVARRLMDLRESARRRDCHGFLAMTRSGSIRCDCGSRAGLVCLCQRRRLALLRN
jgi:hypothetical protein